MEESFHVPSDDSQINQGDIVEQAPWGLVEAPVTLCRPAAQHKNLPSGDAKFGRPEDLQSPPAWSGSEGERIHGLGYTGPAMVLWHGCQLDKWKSHAAANDDRAVKRQAKAFAAIAPIFPLERQSSELQAAIAGGRHHSYFPLPALQSDTRLPASYVDLRHIWSVRQSLLSKRVVGISGAALASLYEHLFRFFTRFTLDVHPTCPNCGTSVELAPASPAED